MRRCFCILLSAFVLALPAKAQEDLNQSAAIDILLTYSKVGDQLGNMSEGFERSVSQMNLQLDQNQRQILVEQGTAAFDSTRLVGYAKDYFAEHYQEDLAVEAVRQLRSRFAESIDSALQADTEPAELRQYAQGIQANPPSQERVQLIQRMSRAQQAPQFYFDNIMGLSRAVAEAAGAVTNAPVQNQALPDSLMIRRNAQNMALVSFLYMFKDVPPEALEEYVSFSESEAGQWYVKTYSAAINRAIEQASASLNAELEANE
jgi:hypothetical protein